MGLRRDRRDRGPVDLVQGARAVVGHRRVDAVRHRVTVFVPVVHSSVRWWRSLHQQATFLAPERPPADPRMALALLLAVAAASVCATWVLAHRVVRLQRQLDAARADGPRRPVRSGARRPAPVG